MFQRQQLFLERQQFLLKFQQLFLERQQLLLEFQQLFLERQQFLFERQQFLLERQQFLEEQKWLFHHFFKEIFLFEVLIIDQLFNKNDYLHSENDRLIAIQ